MINIAVVGIGYWGPNLVRNFSEARDPRVLWLFNVDKLSSSFLAMELGA